MAGRVILPSDPIVDGFDDFHARCNQEKNIKDFLRSDKARSLFKYDQMSSILSVGTACGKIDSAFLSLCKNAEQFVGIEPVSVRSEEGSKYISRKHPHIHVTFYNGCFEDYEGPDEKVDMLLLSHVVYYFKDLRSTIKRAAAMVKRGGKILIMISYDGIPKILGIPGWINYDKKIREAIEKNNLIYTEVPLPDTEIDLTHEGKGYYDFLYMPMKRSMSIEERKECIGKLMKTVVPGTNIYPQPHKAFIIQK